MSEHTRSDAWHTSKKRNIARVPARRPTVIRLSFLSLSFLCLILILWHSDAVISYMKQGLSLCAKTVIPSLFPFMVISELLVASGGGEVLGKLFEKPFKRLFGISGAGVCALIMGLICGFPIGTKTAVSLCRRGQISPEELSRLICFCNIPSSAFLINAVGISLFGSRRFGLFLYSACLISSILTAQILRRTLSSPSSNPPEPPSASTHRNGGFTYAVTSAATAMLYVCAYVVFFSALSGTIGQLLLHLGMGQTQIAFVSGLFELSGGVMQASAIENTVTSRWLTALFCGWSGISVHLQILSLCDELPSEKRIGTARYFFCKGMQGFTCAMLCGIALYFAPSSWFESTELGGTSAVSSSSFQNIPAIINVSLLFFLILFLLWHICKRKKPCAKKG